MFPQICASSALATYRTQYKISPTVLTKIWRITECTKKNSPKMTQNVGNFWDVFGRSWTTNCWHQVNFTEVTLKYLGYFCSNEECGRLVASKLSVQKPDDFFVSKKTPRTTILKRKFCPLLTLGGPGGQTFDMRSIFWVTPEKFGVWWFKWSMLKAYGIKIKTAAASSKF